MSQNQTLEQINSIPIDKYNINIKNETIERCIEQRGINKHKL